MKKRNDLYGFMVTLQEVVKQLNEKA